VGRLIAGLQRGTVPGADSSVAFLCQKFTMLLERLQRAENCEQECQDRRAHLEAELQCSETAFEAECSELSAAVQSEDREVRGSESALREARRCEADVSEEVANMRGEEEALALRKRGLDEECSDERARLAETNGRLRHIQLSRTGGQEDLRRLQGELETLTARYAAAATELRSGRERAGRDEGRLAKLRAEALGEEEARDHASEVGATRREELDEALSGLAVLKERLAEVQVALQHCEDELKRRADQKQLLWGELQRREARLATAARELEDLCSVEQGYEKIVAETTDLRIRLHTQEAEQQRAEAEVHTLEVHAEEAEAQLEGRAWKVSEAEQEEAALRSHVNVAEGRRSELEAEVERLRHDEVTSSGVNQNLQSELQLLHAEADRLRRDLHSSVGERSEAHQRIQLVTPALTEAKRRVRELEEGVEALHSEAARELQLGLRLEREAGACQDKLRALRDENVRLSERCTELEAVLAQSQTSSQRSVASHPCLRGGGGSVPTRTRGSQQLPGSSGPCGAVSRGLGRMGSASCLRSCSGGTGRTIAVAEGSNSSTCLRKGTSLPRTPRKVFNWGFEPTPSLQDSTGWANSWVPQPSLLSNEAGCEPRADLLQKVLLQDDNDGRLEALAQDLPRELPAPVTSTPQGLQYLRNWIESEEERLGPAGSSPPPA